MKERKKIETIKRLSEIINKLNDNKNTIITITDVIMPSKGCSMKIYLSVFPDKNEWQIIQYLNSINFKIKKECLNLLHFRHLPQKIIFKTSKSIKEGDELLKLISNLSTNEQKT